MQNFAQTLSKGIILERKPHPNSRIQLLFHKQKLAGEHSLSHAVPSVGQVCIHIVPRQIGRVVFVRKHSKIDRCNDCDWRVNQLLKLQSVIVFVGILLNQWGVDDSNFSKITVKN